MSAFAPPAAAARPGPAAKPVTALSEQFLRVPSTVIRKKRTLNAKVRA